MDHFVSTANEGKPFRDTFVFDCHGHLGLYQSFYIPDNSGDQIINVLDKLGINKLAVSTFSQMAPFGNDIVARMISDYPKRFIGYARVNANYPGIMRSELIRCVDELGFKGIKIHPYLDQVFIGDAGYKPVWEFATERNIPILIHTWNSLRYNDPLLKFCAPGQVKKIARNYPDAKIILGHSGGEYDGILESIEVAKDAPNVYLDTASSRLYPGVVEMMVNAVGAERILYGSDVPFLSPIPQIGKIIYAAIDESEKQMILGLNAAKLFGLKKE